MSDEGTRCEQVGQWLLEPGFSELAPELSGHAESCDSCREQVWLHHSLAAAFAEEDVPELSANFNAGLEKKLVGARVEVRRLAGWRMAAMLGYAVAATGISGWALRGIPMPTIDLSAPWVPVAMFIAVPMTLLLAVTASRWLPGPAPKAQQRALAL